MHEISFESGRAEIAYRGQVPWHGHGTVITDGDEHDLDNWRIRAGMDWTIEKSPVLYKDTAGVIRVFPKQVALHRSDTNTPLSVVSSRFKVVQPADVINFFSDLVGDMGFQMEVAGVLQEGRRLWALARTPMQANVGGFDDVNAYLLLATACDGSMRTTAQFTTVRVVCANTLGLSLNKDSTGSVKVSHRSVFDATKVKQHMGLVTDTFGKWEEDATRLQKIPVDDHQAIKLFSEVTGTELGPFMFPNSKVSRSPVLKGMYEAFGYAPGAQANLWGAVNAVTYYVDHVAPERKAGNRLNKAWFGVGNTLKQKAWNLALQKAA